MIVTVGKTRFRGADVFVAFRELWWSAKGTAGYSDERGEFIAGAIRALATEALAVVPGAEPDGVGRAVETFMRRVETDRLNTPVFLLVLGGLLGRYVLSDESPRDTEALRDARERLRSAWWASGLDKRALRPGD